MDKAKLEQQYKDLQLNININDYSDEIEFFYFKEDLMKVAKAKLFVNLDVETPEEKLHSFFKSLSMKTNKVINTEINFNELPTIEDQINVRKQYNNVVALRKLGLEVEDWEIISDEEVEFFKNYGRETA